MRTFTLPEFEKFQMTSGTENCYELKSTWIHLCGYIETDGEDQTHKVSNFLHQVKQSLQKAINKYNFRSNFIFDPDFPDSFEWTHKGFYNLQVNLYLNEKMDYKKLNRIMTSVGYMLDESYGQIKSVDLNKFAPYSKGNKLTSRKRPS